MARQSGTSGFDASLAIFKAMAILSFLSPLPRRSSTLGGLAGAPPQRIARSSCSTICLFRRTSSSDFSGAPPSGPTPSCQMAAGWTPLTSSCLLLASSSSLSSSADVARSTVKPSRNSMRITVFTQRSPSGGPFLCGSGSQSSRRTWCSAPSALVTPCSGEETPSPVGPAASARVRTTAALASTTSVCSSRSPSLLSTSSIASTHLSTSPTTLPGFEAARAASFSRGSDSSTRSSRSFAFRTASQTASVTPPPRCSAPASPSRRSWRAPLAPAFPPSRPPKKLLIGTSTVR
mmetsp:Transcript_106957/g.230357  ORF Transcript_106957/g.230357 Transcript_106957/m.230357 type:complete len:291 (-) Transcript_106957:72-944(-)